MKKIVLNACGVKSLGGLKLINPASNATGTYSFVDTLDLGGTFSLVLKRHFQGVKSSSS